MKIVRTLTFMSALLAGATSAGADIRTGRLLCRVAPGTGYVILSQKALTCRYDSVDGRREYYSGTISKFGLDIGVTGATNLVWAVFEPAVRPGSLSGIYSGGTAEFSMGLGIGANALIGGGEGGITLQPLSVQAQTGLNVAAGVGELTLNEMEPPLVELLPERRHKRHHRS